MAGGSYFGVGYWPDNDWPDNYWPIYTTPTATTGDEDMAHAGAGLAGMRSVRRQLLQWNMVILELERLWQSRDRLHLRPAPDSRTS